MNVTLKILLLLSLLWLVGCGSGNIYTAAVPVDSQHHAESPIGPYGKMPDGMEGIREILIFPFKDITAVYGSHANVRSPLDGNMFMTGKVEKDAADFLTDRLLSLMRSRFSYEIVPPSRACCMVSERFAPHQLEGRLNRALSQFQITVETGLAADVDAVLAGHLYRFENRVGKQYSVDSPASVTFDLHLIKLSQSDKNGRIVWTGRFQETQLPLFENFLKLGTFVKRGGKWLTAYEMADTALGDMLKTLPKNP